MKNYIPKSKGDLEAVTNLQLLPFEEVRTDVPQLLEWMQDLNWEVGRGIADYLFPYINVIQHDLLAILLGDDESWKYWILGFIAHSPDRPADELMVVINRIANYPTKIEQGEEVDIIAKGILTKYR
jgi:hypothetical protein